TRWPRDWSSDVCSSDLFPATEDFARFLGSIGVGPQTHVVAYDDAGGSIAARLWFLLRVHGHDRASVLDGGFQAWKAAGLPVTAEDRKSTRLNSSHVAIS